MGYKGNFEVFAVDNEFVGSATVENQLKKYKLDSDSIYEIISEM